MQHGEDLLADLSMPRNFAANAPATVEDIDQLMQQISVICQQQSRVLNLTKAVMSERIREIEDAILVGHVDIARSAMGGILSGKNKPAGVAGFQAGANSSSANNNNQQRFRDPAGGRPGGSTNLGNTPDGSWTSSAGNNTNTNNKPGSGSNQFIVSSDSSRQNNNNNNSNNQGQQQFGIDYDDLLVSAEEDNRREQQMQQIQSGGKSYMTQSASAAPSTAHLAARAAASAAAAANNSSSHNPSAAGSLSRPGSGAGDLPSPFSQSMGRMGGGSDNSFGPPSGSSHTVRGGNFNNSGLATAPSEDIQFFVTVQFKRGRMLTYESSVRVSAGQFVIVGGDRGEDIGSVVACWPIVEPPPPNAVADRATGGDNGAGTQVLRVATITEVAQLQGIQNELENRAAEVAQVKVREHGLQMRIVDAEYQFDRKKLTFYYDAAQRLDFRVLVRDLYKVFRSRVWMEKI